MLAGGHVDGAAVLAWVGWSLAFLVPARRGSTRAVRVVAIRRLSELTALSVFFGVLIAGPVLLDPRRD